MVVCGILVDAAADGGDAEEGLGPVSVGVNLFKCAVGAGSFSLPAAFKTGGFWATFILIFVLGFLAWYTVSLLALAERKYRAQSSTPRSQRTLAWERPPKSARRSTF